MTLALGIAALWLVMLWAPNIPVSCLLRRVMVEAPARWCAAVTRGHIYLAVTLALTVLGVAWLLGSDGLGMLGMASPDILAGIAMFDIATYLDVAVTAILVGGTMQFGTAIRAIAWLRRVPRRRQRRTRRATRVLRADKDVEDRRALAA